MDANTLVKYVARHAEESGPRVAVSAWRPGIGFTETSYADLYRKVRRFAALFGRLSAPGSMITLLVGKSAEGIAAMLGAMAAGRGFCFVNTKYRGPQVATVIETSRAPVCLVDPAGLVSLRGAVADVTHNGRATWVLIGEEGIERMHAKALNSLRQAAPVVLVDEREDEMGASALGGGATAVEIGACLFTSGSSGEPKGVLVSSEDLIRRVEAEIAWFELRPEDVLLSILPFSFDVGLNQLLTALRVGAELVLLGSWLPADMLSAVELRKVTGISGVPSIWQGLINAGSRFEKQGRHKSLRYITVSGGSLAPGSLKRLREITAGVRVFKTYGQTEAFRATSLRPEDLERKSDSVGRPFPGVRVYVVREDGSGCAPGEIGEVVHTGLGVMAGYLTDREMVGSEGKLRRNPFFGENDPSAYAVFTGDLGYLDEEGYLYLKGRRDSMIKIQGNRVYPQEVANQILAVPGVGEAVVVGEKGDAGQGTITAFIVPAPGVELTPALIRKELNKRLPAYMIPKRTVFVPSIPRTATGKPDERRLVEIYVAPRVAG